MKNTNRRLENRRKEEDTEFLPLPASGWGTTSSRARTVLWSTLPWQVCLLGSVSTTYSPRDGCRLLILLISSFLTTSRYGYLVLTMCWHWCILPVCRNTLGTTIMVAFQRHYLKKLSPLWWEQDGQFSGSMVIKSTLTTKRADRPVVVPP